MNSLIYKSYKDYNLDVTSEDFLVGISNDGVQEVKFHGNENCPGFKLYKILDKIGLRQ